MRLANSFVASFIRNFSHLPIYGKIGTSSNIQFNLGHSQIASYDLGDHLSPHLRASHNSLPYIWHHSPQVLVSSRRINRRESNPKLLLTLNLECSNYSLIQGLCHTCNNRWKENLSNFSQL